MGMDVVGKKPTGAAGEYFRNNMWYWRPLWDWCMHIAPELLAEVNGHYNDGEGLDADGAAQLARIIRSHIDDGRAQQAIDQFNQAKAEVDRQDCNLCDATGIRTDQVGIDLGMPDKELEESLRILLGRDRGWCNGCNGEGLRSHLIQNYHMDISNIVEFAEFLEDCGGFEIW